MIQTQISYKGHTYEIDLDAPLDISIPVGRHTSPNAFHLRKPGYETVEEGSFVGDVLRGGSCNVENISFSPHGNGTHTECIGHIDSRHEQVNTVLKRNFFLARLVTVSPHETPAGAVIDKKCLEGIAYDNLLPVEALIIRTHPNGLEKRTMVYGGTNPAWFTTDAMEWINSLHIIHLLTDLPSVDKEDDGLLAAHHVFFEGKKENPVSKTITEMIYADDSIRDGLYWVDLQIAGFESDASPSKPMLYETRITD